MGRSKRFPKQYQERSPQFFRSHRKHLYEKKNKKRKSYPIKLDGEKNAMKTIIFTRVREKAVVNAPNNKPYSYMEALPLSDNHHDRLGKHYAHTPLIMSATQ